MLPRTSRAPEQANEISMYKCDCGCGTLKMVIYNNKHRPFTCVSFSPDEWLDVTRNIDKICMDMKGEKVQ